MSKRELTYNSVKDVINDVEQLKRGHQQHGNWNLAQASWHCRGAIGRCLKEVPAGTQSTPEQIEAQKSRLNPLLSGGKIPSGLPTPPGADPVKDVPQPLTEAEIDGFIADLKNLDASQLKQVMFGPFGIISMDQFRKFIQVHTANHMQHFAPAS
jgi:Protein of unknown function (DUF1569)